ncbi:mutS protein homolog 4-like [Daktulosphaira vitifoliae]|uniref:mutS protein homolog 4-like n=1 Tax=Daktulosphaira vitifoliae TaxID=58002 RepID=UPI0021A9DADE|nr:mutS protein homolog 4-like [Daktulosphaira vitifoliae]
MNIVNNSGNRQKATNDDFQVVRMGRYKVPQWPKKDHLNPSHRRPNFSNTSTSSYVGQIYSAFKIDKTPNTPAVITGTPVLRSHIASSSHQSTINDSDMEKLFNTKLYDRETSKNIIHQQVVDMVTNSTPHNFLIPQTSFDQVPNFSGPKNKNKPNNTSIKPTSSTITSKLSESTKNIINNSVIIVLTEGRCSSQGTVGLASIDLKRPVITLSQINDTQNYVNTITKINVLNPAEIVVPDTFMEMTQGTVMYNLIKDQFPSSTMVTALRKHFCSNQGKVYLKNAVLSECLSVLEQTLTKYYALAAAAALFKYIEFQHNTIFSSNTLQLEYVGVEKSMFIDANSALRLELVINNLTRSSKNTLYDVLNYCSTFGGKRRLRASILQPSSDIQFIFKRQMAVEEIREVEEGDLNLLTKTVEKFSDVEKLYWLCTKVPKDSLSMSKLQGNYTLLLKSALDALPTLVNMLKPFQSEILLEIHKVLSNKEYSKMLEIIEITINNESIRSRGYSQSQFQRCFAIRSNLNIQLDLYRTTYSKLISQFQDNVYELGELFMTDGLIMNNSANRGFHVHLYLKNAGRFDVNKPPSICKNVEKTKTFIKFTTTELLELNYRINQTLNEIEALTNEILYEMLQELRKYIGRVYDLCNSIADLDLILSFVKFSKRSGLCRPTFGQNIDVVNSKHPILQLVCEAVGNDVFGSSDKNLIIITGPNMGGKSIYIRQIALLQIMAQIGCYVPATKAQFRICDRLLTRLTFSDSIETNASTWVLEIKEINSFFQAITNHSLVIIDELCRGTTSEEGSSLAWAICEQLMQSRAIIYVATHSVLLTKLNNIYCNVENFCMEALLSSDSASGLEYTYKLKPEVTPISHYGLALARDLNFPPFLVDYAAEIEECLYNSEAELPDYPSNEVDRAMDNLVIEFLRLKDIEHIDADIIISLTKKMLEDLENNSDITSDKCESSYLSTQNVVSFAPIQHLGTFENDINVNKSEEI